MRSYFEIGLLIQGGVHIYQYCDILNITFFFTFPSSFLHMNNSCVTHWKTCHKKENKLLYNFIWKIKFYIYTYTYTYTNIYIYVYMIHNYKFNIHIVIFITYYIRLFYIQYIFCMNIEKVHFSRV